MESERMEKIPIFLHMCLVEEIEKKMIENRYYFNMFGWEEKWGEINDMCNNSKHVYAHNMIW